ncbi:IS66 family insertion sequence element accessory protein TnpA [Chitinophaga sp. LS1]|uniref:IS66 family insertion sequence element accessory protein TnpA n=1 Tax=Chitinophaga sp. LS1 TaxID=3051176 RepID=UPI002AAC2851|nr:transposase [Chitinophaga sp. LS1]WPV67108.1 transposase [Chitinophaga sp. LS1]WPV70349.1 transposase [Chitinophaga sp. LS1]WPV70567.1 transposase [Chitinophaga sp. LS1]
MNNKTKKASHSRYSSEEIITMLDQFDRDNVSLKEFCADKGISQATFFNWRKRYLSRSVNNSSFIELITSAPNAEVPLSTGGIFAEFRGIRIYQPVSAAYLKALIS